MYKLKGSVQVSLCGCTVTTIPAGEYETLPEIAVKRATALELFEGKSKGKEVPNSEWTLPEAEDKKADSE